MHAVMDTEATAVTGRCSARRVGGSVNPDVGNVKGLRREMQAECQGYQRASSPTAASIAWLTASIICITLLLLLLVKVTPSNSPCPRRAR